MSSLTPGEIDRLVRSQRNLNISGLVAVVVLVGIIVLLAVAGISLVPGALVGAGIGFLLSMPHRRLINELGLDRKGARAVIVAEKKRRKSLR